MVAGPPGDSAERFFFLDAQRTGWLCDSGAGLRAYYRAHDMKHPDELRYPDRQTGKLGYEPEYQPKPTDHGDYCNCPPCIVVMMGGK